MIHKLILVVISILLFNNSIVAQKTTYPIPAQYPNAFIDYIYTANQVKVVTEIYNKNATALSFPANINSPKSNVDLDIYYADDASIKFPSKPLIIFAPGGGGNKNVYNFIAKDLARRGYVVASISLRKNAINNIQLLLEGKKIHPYLTMTGAMDIHIAIKYLLNQRAEKFNINKNFVIIGGGSFGGATSYFSTFVSRKEAIETFGDNAKNPFYNEYDDELQKNTIKGAICLFGGVYTLNYITADDKKPTFMFHGTADPAVPYNEGNMFYNPLDVYIMGSTKIAERFTEVGNSFLLVTGKDVGHTMTPECNYNTNTFPAGYPKNWYPDMLAFLRTSVLGNKSTQMYKTIDCITADCSLPSNSCRVAQIGQTPPPAKAKNSKIPNQNYKKIEIDNTTTVYNPTLNPIIVPTSKPFDHCKAFYFDGDDFVKVDKSAPITTGFDVEFWYKSTISNTTNNVSILFSMGNDKNLKNNAINVGLLNNNELYIGYNNGIQYLEKTRKILDKKNMPYTVDNQWHHYHIKIGTPNILIEIDGNEAQVNFANEFNSTKNTANTMNTYFGGADFSAIKTNYSFTNAAGQLHAIRVWNSDYTFSNSKFDVDGTTNGLVASWKLNENSPFLTDDGKFNLVATLGNSNNTEKSDPIFINNCDANNQPIITIPVVIKDTIKKDTVKVIPPIVIVKDTTKTPIVTPKDTLPLQTINDGISILYNTTSTKPILLFYSNSIGKAKVVILNKSNKTILSAYKTIQKGDNSLNSYFTKLKNGTYTIRITLNNKKYARTFYYTK